MSLSITASGRTQPAHGRALRSLAYAVALLILPAATYAADVPLTLAEAQRLAVTRSHQLLAKGHAAGSARDMAAAAGQLPDPVLTVGIENLPLQGDERFSLGRESMTMRRIGVMQELTSADKRRLRAERFDREAEKARAEQAALAAAIRRDTAIAWLDRHYAEATAALVAEQAAQARLEIQAAEAAYRAGKGSQSDIFSARSALVEIEDRASQSRRQLANTGVMLARWVGDDAARPLAGKPQLDAVALDPTTLETALAHHPEIAVLARQEDIAETEARLARANRKADWSIEVAYQKRGSAFSDMVSVGVSVPLQFNRKLRQDRELAASIGQAAQARGEREEALRAHVAELRILLNEWENTRERHARNERELVPLATSGAEAAMAAYRGGKASLAEVLRAGRSKLDARLQSLQLEADAARLWAQLNFLLPHDELATAPAANQHKDLK